MTEPTPERPEGRTYRMTGTGEPEEVADLAEARADHLELSGFPEAAKIARGAAERARHAALVAATEAREAREDEDLSAEVAEARAAEIAYAPDLAALRGGAATAGRPLLLVPGGEPYALPGHLVTMAADGRAVCVCGDYSGQVASVAPDAVVIWADRHYLEKIGEAYLVQDMINRTDERLGAVKAGQVVLGVDPAFPDGPAAVMDAEGRLLGHVADSDVAPPALPSAFRPLVAGGDLGSRLAEVYREAAGERTAPPEPAVDCTMGTHEDPRVIDLGRVPGGPRRIAGVDVGSDGTVAMTLVDMVEDAFPPADPPVLRLVVPLLTGERPEGEERHVRLQVVAHAAEVQARLEAIQTALHAMGLDTTAHAVAYLVQLLGELAAATPELLGAHPDELAELATAEGVSAPAASLMADTAAATRVPPDRRLHHPATPRDNRSAVWQRQVYPRDGRQ